MTTYAPPKICACPSCQAPQAIWVMRSGNTFGSTLWSDGYLDAPMLPRDPPFRVCAACGGSFVDGEARYLGQVERETGAAVRLGGERAARPDYAHKPNEAQCYAALAAGFPQARGIELAVRIFAWHLRNDRHREPTSSRLVKPDLPAWSDNARALLGLLGPERAEDRLMAAELHRHLGEFDAALRVLEVIRSENLLPMVATIRKAAERGWSHVVVLRGSD